MARVTTIVEPLNRDVEAIIAEELTPAARSRILAAFAGEQRDEAQLTNLRALGRVPSYDQAVDGRRDAPLEAVRPDGVVAFEFDLLADLFAFVHDLLVTHSPYRSGSYRANHVLLADGAVVPNLAAVPEAKAYEFVNTVPYARKIERGLSPQAPDGVYEVVATLAKRRFGNVATIKFTYRSPLLPYVVIGRKKAQRLSTSPAKRSAANIERATRAPAIRITV